MSSDLVSLLLWSVLIATMCGFIVGCAVGYTLGRFEGREDA